LFLWSDSELSTNTSSSLQKSSNKIK
jgi:hypothetical protein